MVDGRPRWVVPLRTTAFRLTVLHLLLTLVGTALLSGVLWWATVGFATRQAAQEIERGMGVLMRAAALSGSTGLVLSIDARLGADRADEEVYGLTTGDGRFLAGNLDVVPDQPGWQEVTVPLVDGNARSLLLLAAKLPDGDRLVVGRDLQPIRALERRLLGAAGWVAAGAVVLGLGGGLLIGRSVARRTLAMTRSLTRVERGELDHRLPVTGRADEVDRLAAGVNAMLDRLQQVMATLRQVTDDIAHDLRTPLSRLRQRLEAAEEDATDEVQAERLRAAKDECDELLEVFRSLLQIAQVEAEQVRERFADVDLSQVTTAVVEVYAPAAEEHDMRLTTAIADGILVHGERALLTQMVANLVQNAIRHGRDGGRIEVALQRDSAARATLSVVDDGPGIPVAERDRVFRRFHRLDRARSSPGSGLGLALVRAVADLHQMTITLDDAAPGLRVRVTIPLTRTAPQAANRLDRRRLSGTPDALPSI
ncbi:MAG: HAMP domain-containing sensor histidine kinase [Pseudomonadota bacterium]